MPVLRGSWFFWPSSRTGGAVACEWALMILDIGPRSVEQVVSVLARAKTLVWNGPLGAFEMEPFDNGTVAVARKRRR